MPRISKDVAVIDAGLTDKWTQSTWRYATRSESHHMTHLSSICISFHLCLAFVLTFRDNSAADYFVINTVYVSLTWTGKFMTQLYKPVSGPTLLDSDMLKEHVIK